MKLKIIVLLFAVQGLYSLDFDHFVQMDLEWKPGYRVLNQDNPFNPDNFLLNNNLTNHAEANLWFDIYIGPFDFIGNLNLEIDSSRDQYLIDSASGSSSADYSEAKLASLGFEQLYVQWNLPNGWILGAGNYPLRHGFSRIYAPMNYNARLNDFRNSSGQWNSWLMGYFGGLQYAFRYYPVIEFRSNPNDKNEAERFFSWLETSLKRQTFSLQFSYFFFDSLDTSLIAFVQEKNAYNFKSFYLAGALGFSWSILDRLILRFEGLYGNGFDDLKNVQKSPDIPAPYAQYAYTDRNPDSPALKFLGGITTILPLDVEVSLEYFYNGAAYSNDEKTALIDAALESGEYYQNADAAIAGSHKAFLAGGLENLKIYEMGRHYMFLQFMRRDIAGRFDILNTSVLLLSDLSFYNSSELSFRIDDFFNLGLDINFLLFEKKDAFVLFPYKFETSLWIRYSL